MAEQMKKAGKKKFIIIGIVAIAIIALGITLICVFSSNELKTVEVKTDTGYTKTLKKDDSTLKEVESALQGYTKSEDGSYTVFSKGKETVKVKTGADGKVNYISYNNELPNDVQVKVKGFNESMIKIGDNEKDVQKIMEPYDFIYHLKTSNKKGQQLHIYYYGWTGSEAALELVFIDGKLTYYTIHSDELAAKSEAPDIKDIK